MFKKFKRLFIVIPFILGILFFTSTVFAQDAVTVVRQDLTQGVTLELNPSVLSPTANFIVIDDSANQTLALSSLLLDDQSIWMKKSNGVVDVTNTVNWYNNEDSEFLYIDISGIKNSFSPNTILQLTILPVKTNKTNLSISIFESSTDSGNLPDGLQKISDLKVDLK